MSKRNNTTQTDVHTKSRWSPPPAKDLHFDIDRYLNPWIPRSRVDRLPRPISRFLGYRDAPRRPIGNLVIAAWSFFGGFCGTAALSGLFMASFIEGAGAPIIIGSYGAAAILEYNAIESPFSQPRNSVVGQFLAALIGVSITKLFALSASFERLRWIAGALAVGTSSAAMTLTNTVHPPAGATALLACISPDVSGLGWLYLGIVLLSSLVTLAVACLVNNVQRQYPLYWWSPGEKITRTKTVEADAEKGGKVEKVETVGEVEELFASHADSEVIISAGRILVPERLYLSGEERGMLKILEGRLRDTRAEEMEAQGRDSSTIAASMRSGSTVQGEGSDGGRRNVRDS